MLPALRTRSIILEKSNSHRPRTEEMRPEWFSAYPASVDSVHPPIPFDTMWEESVEWLPSVLDFYLPTVKAVENSQVIHHVTFKGGLNPETGLEDIWHGMDENFIKWIGNGKADEEGYPGRLEDWTEDIRERWVQERRKARSWARKT